MSYNLKDATIDDLPYIVEVYNSIIPLGNVTADQHPITVDDWTPWFNEHTAPNRPIYLLKHNNNVCGWMSFSDYKKRCAYDSTAEISIYLDEKERGKGLGNIFIELGLKTLKQIGLKNVLAVIYADNTTSVNLFKKLGFDQWGLLPGVCEVKGECRDIVILGKAI